TRAGVKGLAWSDTFDGAAEDMFTLQGRVALSVADALGLQTSARTRATLQSPAAIDSQAFADYSLGISLIERPHVPRNIDRAIESFKRSIARAPRFAPAYARGGFAFWHRYIATHDARWIDKARDMALDALRLDPADVDVRCTLARIYLGT